jgi:hypothetical protein
MNISNSDERVTQRIHLNKLDHRVYECIAYLISKTNNSYIIFKNKPVINGCIGREYETNYELFVMII